MLKVGGENVSAAEVEGYLITHPAIALAQVVSAPDERYVEVPAAYIQLKPYAQQRKKKLLILQRERLQRIEFLGMSGLLMIGQCLERRLRKLSFAK